MALVRAPRHPSHWTDSTLRINGGLTAVMFTDLPAWTILFPAVQYACPISSTRPVEGYSSTTACHVLDSSCVPACCVRRAGSSRRRACAATSLRGLASARRSGWLFTRARGCVMLSEMSTFSYR
jgi:hypothetical protein